MTKQDKKNIIKKDTNTKKKDKVNKNVLGRTNNINFFNDIISKLDAFNIIGNKELRILLEDKEEGFVYNDLESFLDDIISKFGEEKELNILKTLFNWEFEYQIETKTWVLQPLLLILDLFNKDNPKSLPKEKRDIIFKSKILPIKIIVENKIKKLVFISRTPIITNNFLWIFKDIIEQEKIIDWEIIIVSKAVYEEIESKLQNEEYEIYL